METWMKDELVKDIPKEKLEFLSKMQGRGNAKTQREWMRQMLPLMQEAKAQGLQFTPGEVSAAIAAIRKYSSQEENDKIDEILKRVNRN